MYATGVKKSSEFFMNGESDKKGRHPPDTPADTAQIEGEICPDHVHLLVSIPPKMSVSGFMGYLKGKSSLMIFQRYGNMKFAYRNREFWCKGYYVDTVGKNTKAIKEYISEQLKKDQEADQLMFS